MPHPLPDAQGNIHTRPIPLPAGYRLLVMDSGVRHTNTRNEFNQRVAACRAGVALLRREWPAITHLRPRQRSGRLPHQHAGIGRVDRRRPSD